MKILWLSNRLFSQESARQSGTWLLALGPELAARDEIELANISFGSGDKVEPADFGNIRQWKIPALSLKPGQLPPDNIVRDLLKAIDSFQPDLIQIWGVEQFWGLLLSKNLLKYPVIVNIQGVMRTIAASYAGGLGIKEKLQCIRIRECFYPRDSVFGQELFFDSLGRVEQTILSAAKYITVQSEWSAAQVRAINPRATYFRTERTLRPEFYTCSSWSPPQNGDAPVIFTSSFGNPYKGFHYTLRALKGLKADFPGVKLRVAGGHLKQSWKNTGYNQYLLKIIRKLNLEDNIVWLGSLDADGLIQELQQSDCFVHSSFVESYSLAVAEALAVGTPTVCSYAGALPEMSGDPANVLFYPPGDDVRMASLVRQVLLNPEQALMFSERSRAFIFARCDRESILQQQIHNYRMVLERELSR